MSLPCLPLGLSGAEVHLCCTKINISNSFILLAMAEIEGSGWDVVVCVRVSCVLAYLLVAGRGLAQPDPRVGKAKAQTEAVGAKPKLVLHGCEMSR